MILVDTGAWLALADRGDAYHARCREFFRHNREPLMTTLSAICCLRRAELSRVHGRP